MEIFLRVYFTWSESSQLNGWLFILMSFARRNSYVPCLQGHEGSRSQLQFAIVKPKPNGTLNA